MNLSFEKVLGSLLDNKSVDEVSVSHLEQLADDHPYFAIAHLLLAKKLRTDNNPSFLLQAQKTALYFSNPYWLDLQLNELEEPDLKLSENLSGESINENGENLGFSLKAENLQKETEGAKEILTPGPMVDGDKKITQGEEETAVITRDTDPETDRFVDNPEDKPEMLLRDNIEAVLLETLSAAEQDEAIEVLEEMAGVINEPEVMTSEFLQEAEVLSESTDDKNVAFEKTSGDIHFEEKSSFLVDTNKENELPDEHDLMFRNIKAMLDATSEEAEADIKSNLIPIDPYYTIDYFASQGIKLDLDLNPKDELGQNLKKFTQWLKHMKKLGPEDATEVISRNNETEADIQKIADSSNTVREIVTEAMAQVLEKQGKKDKAIELYSKLSFLNPDKSIYFANKIKSLKGI